MPPPLRLSSWPYVVVRIDCVLCPRRGSYRLARLAVRFGPDAEMERLLAHLASDCPWWRARPRKYEARCGARYTDLDRAALPDLPPGVATEVLRHKAPPREAVPQRRHADRRSGAFVMPMLSGVTAPAFAFTCRRCGRREVLVVEALLAEGDRRLTDLSWAWRAACPKREAAVLHERCDVVYDEIGDGTPC